MSVWARVQPLTSGARGRSRSTNRLACVDRPVTEVQRSFDQSILEGQVTSSTDIQEFKVTGGNQPWADIDLREVTSIPCLCQPTKDRYSMQYHPRAVMCAEICIRL